MKKEIKLGYAASEKQTSFHKSKARYRFYGGAAGGGKTEALFQEAIAQIIEYMQRKVPVNGIIFRRTFPELERTHIRKFVETIPKELATYNASKHVATFRNGAILEFGHCDHEGDIRNYLSAEYDFICIDELTQLTEYQIKMLLTRLRTRKKGVFTNFFAASNPGDVGHAFVKRLWVSKEFNRDELTAGYKTEDFAFIPASIYDNRFLCDADPSYIKRLEALPEKQRRIYLEGDWDVFEGQFFNEWRRDIHIVRPFPIPKTWQRYICIDYGYRAPSAVYWVAIEPQDGREYTYRELYQSELTAKELAERILEMTPEEEEIEKVIMDPACWGKTGQTDKSISEIMSDNGIFAIKANNNRVAGANLFREYLKPYRDQDGVMTARFLVFDTCPNLIRTLPQLIHSKTKPEDVDTKGEDHAYDARRYGLMSGDYQVDRGDDDYTWLEAQIDPRTGYVKKDEIYVGGEHGGR